MGLLSSEIEIVALFFEIKESLLIKRDRPNLNESSFAKLFFLTIISILVIFYTVILFILFDCLVTNL